VARREELCVDNSRLSAVAACDTKATLRYILGWTSTEEHAALKAGTAVHKALEVYFRTGYRKPALQAFTDCYADWADEYLPVEPWAARLDHDNVRTILKVWMRQNPLGGLPYIADYVEVSFQHELAPGVIVEGRLDLLTTHRQTRAAYVLDHKSTGQVTSYWLQQFTMSSQLSGYVWGAAQQTGRPFAGALVNAIQLSKLPDATERKCREHGLPYAECREHHVKADLFLTQRSPQQIEDWKADALRLAKRYARLVEKADAEGLDCLPTLAQQGTFTGACRFCEFIGFCKSNRNPGLVTSMFKHEPWNPLREED